MNLDRVTQAYDEVATVASQAFTESQYRTAAKLTRAQARTRIEKLLQSGKIRRISTYMNDSVGRRQKATAYEFIE